jgi:hypothetical protein
LGRYVFFLYEFGKLFVEFVTCHIRWGPTEPDVRVLGAFVEAVVSDCFNDVRRPIRRFCWFTRQNWTICGLLFEGGERGVEPLFQ